MTLLLASHSFSQPRAHTEFNSGFGDNRKAMLQDLAVITGGQVVSEDLGLKLENITEEYLGTCAKIKVLFVSVHEYPYLIDVTSRHRIDF